MRHSTNLLCLGTDYFLALLSGHSKLLNQQCYFGSFILQMPTNLSVSRKLCEWDIMGCETRPTIDESSSRWIVIMEMLVVLVNYLTILASTFAESKTKINKNGDWTSSPLMSTRVPMSRSLMLTKKDCRRVQTATKWLGIGEAFN